MKIAGNFPDAGPLMVTSTGVRSGFDNDQQVLTEVTSVPIGKMPSQLPQSQKRLDR